MSWEILFTKKAQKQINSLDKTIQLRIKKAIKERLMQNPQLHLEPVVGDMTGFYKFRVGDYRLICTKKDAELVVIVVEMGHRREI